MDKAMKKFGKEFFKAVSKSGKSGKIKLKTDKKFYVAGEMITGTVKAKIKQRIKAKAIILKVTGFEKAEWKVERSTTNRISETETEREYYVDEISKKKEFFKEKIVLEKCDEYVDPGEYEFKFNYQLPEGVPGVFMEERDWRNKRHAGPGVKIRENDQYKDPQLEAKIVYKFKATLDVGGLFAKDLSCKKCIVVHERLEKDVKPAHGEKLQPVMVCCCLNKGDVELKCDFDKNAYAPGETAQVHAKIDNRSTKDVTKMVVKLMRILNLTAGHHTKRFYECVAEEKYDKVEAGKKTEMDMPIKLKPFLQPTTNGKIVHCNYQLEVEAQVSMAKDIEVHMPVILYAPQPDEDEEVDW